MTFYEYFTEYKIKDNNKVDIRQIKLFLQL